MQQNITLTQPAVECFITKAAVAGAINLNDETFCMAKISAEGVIREAAGAATVEAINAEWSRHAELSQLAAFVQSKIGARAA